MKLLFSFSITILVFLVYSCTSLLDEKINQLTLEAKVQSISKMYPELDSTKTHILNDLVSLSKGRLAFLYLLESHLEKLGEIEDLDEIIVNEEKFGQLVNGLFYYIEAKELTFNQLFLEIDTMISINQEMVIEMEKYYKDVDSVCIIIQDAIDKYIRDYNDIAINNYYYETPEKLFGYCPYMNIDKCEDIWGDLLSKKIKIMEERDNKLFLSAPCIRKYEKALKNLCKM